MTNAGVAVLAEGFHKPGPGEFDLPAIALGVTKPMVLFTLGAIIVFWFLYAAARKRAIVPSRLQFAGESAYNFVRNGIARDTIGSEHFMTYVPYLTALFFLLLINNFFGIIPFLQFPTFSHAGYAYGLAALTWILYNGAGIKTHGLGGYLKLQTVPGGVTGPVLALIVPLEALSNFIVRPITLALRLFANMFAGHLLMILFATGGAYLVFEADKALYIPVGIIAWILGILVGFLEVVVMALQAYVFTLLTATYVGGAIADEH